MPKIGSARTRKPRLRSCGCCLGPHIATLKRVDRDPDDAATLRRRKRRKKRQRSDHRHEYLPHRSSFWGAMTNFYALYLRCIKCGREISKWLRK
jgi:hypothetical protein